MNKVILSGRLTADPEISYAQKEDGSLCLAKFNLAIDRYGNGADFPRIRVIGKRAEWVEKYLSKGMRVEVVGRIQTSSFTGRDGQKIYTTDVLAEEVNFGESKKEHESAEGAAGQESFMNIPPEIEEELPF